MRGRIIKYPYFSLHRVYYAILNELLHLKTTPDTESELTLYKKKQSNYSLGLILSDIF